MTVDRVRLVYRKYDGSLHWHQTMEWLGADEHGVWIGGRAGTVIRKGEDGPAVVLEHAHVLLVPPDSWWTAAFNAEPSRVDVYCDIATPSSWPAPDEVTTVDLDLDVVRRRADGSVFLDDVDEFAEHRVRYRYPDEVIVNAEAAAARLMRVVAAREEPFDTAYQEWLARVV